MNKIPMKVMEVLERCTVEGSRLYLPQEQFDRRLYLEVDRVLQAIGGKWNRSAKAHLFPDFAADVVDEIMLTGAYSRTKQDFGQFDSPPEVVARLIELADLRAGQTVFEPSAGIGNIVKAIRAESMLGDGIHYFANELDPKRFESLRADHFPAGGVTNKDFLTMDGGLGYDRIIMNPPFAKSADAHHIMHAYHGFLRASGRLVSVASAAVLFRQDKPYRELRDLAYQNGEIMRLPDGSFKESGTSVNTVIVILRK